MVDKPSCTCPESKLLQPITTSLKAQVGAALTVVKDVIYVWGGRGGKDMAPLYNGDNIHTFDTIKAEWSALKLKEVGEGHAPLDRSYHALTSIKVSF
jgi:N-acetylneuraminic acid mutarotase